MSPDEFWGEDVDLLNSYVRSYVKKVKYESWLNGFYMYQGQLLALGNAFGGKNTKVIEYPKFVDDDDIVDTKEIKVKPNGNNDNTFLSQCL